MNEQRKLQAKFSIWYFLGAMALLLLFRSLVLDPMVTGQQQVTYDRFRQHLADKAITEVTIKPERIYYQSKAASGEEAIHNVVRLEDPELTAELLAAGVKFEATPDKVHKVSIIPTSKGALGYTLQVPDEDQLLIGEQQLRERLAVLFGGRAAELMISGEASSGAANDMEQATQIARRMVTEFGMNASLGPVRYAPNVGMGNFLGGQVGMQEISPETAALIDHDIGDLIAAAQKQALELLQSNRAALEEIAEQLQLHEVISGDAVHQIAHQRGQQDSQVAPKVASNE